MFLHLGGDVLVNQEKIIAIFDLETAMNNGISQKFLSKVQEEQAINYIAEVGKEKSLILTKDGNYFSPISSTTLLKRSMNVYED